MIRILLLIVLAGSIFAGFSAVRSFQHRSIVEPVTNLKVWNWYQGGGSSAGLALDQDGVRCTVLQVVPNDPTCVELLTSTVVLEQSKKYQISFDAKSSLERTMILTAELHGAKNVKDIGLHVDVATTPTWKTYTYEFVPTSVDGQPDKLPMFILGNAIGTVCIRNVEVKVAN